MTDKLMVADLRRLIKKFRAKNVLPMTGKLTAADFHRLAKRLREVNKLNKLPWWTRLVCKLRGHDYAWGTFNSSLGSCRRCGDGVVKQHPDWGSLHEFGKTVTFSDVLDVKKPKFVIRSARRRRVSRKTSARRQK